MYDPSKKMKKLCSQKMWISVSQQEENHKEESEMMFDKNGRQEKISLHYKKVRLICALRAHIKLFIFINIFSKIEKTVITFLIFEKFFFKNRN